ncbi:MAG: hypothetical protein IJJ73_04505, partial [Bacteroidaceae bacterium]|nr:hypothetical protein [Bacteroidaceae bacterium]
IEFLLTLCMGLFSTATLQQNWWKRTGTESLEMPMDTGFRTLSGVSDRGVFCYSATVATVHFGVIHTRFAEKQPVSYKNTF